jgi:hypothetical protein
MIQIEKEKAAAAATMSLAQMNATETSAASNDASSTVAAFAGSEVGPSVAMEAPHIGPHSPKPSPAVIDPQLLFSQSLLGHQESSLFSSEVWGTRTAGHTVGTAQTSYINGPLNQFQRSKLAQAQSSVYSQSSDCASMTPSQLHE